jgi:hypothetical protein
MFLRLIESVVNDSLELQETLIFLAFGPEPYEFLDGAEHPVFMH